MTAITLNRELVQQLLASRAEVELRDETGIVIGSFVPGWGKRPFDLDPDCMPPPMTEEEYQEILTEGPLLTTEEVLAKLRSLE